MVKLYIKSQIALQFIIIISILLFIFIVFLGIISNRNAELNKEELMIQAQDMVNAVQKELVIATTVVDGYSREFHIPSKIGNQNYSIYIGGPTNATLILSFSNNDFTRRIPPITGQPTPGLNRINKAGGVVYLN